MSEWVKETERERETYSTELLTTTGVVYFNGTEKKKFIIHNTENVFCSHCWESKYNIVVIGIFLLQQQQR